jgi:hypothetical protein
VWTKGGENWKRIEIPAERCSRITPRWLERERAEVGEASFRREYQCSFEVVEGLVYPDLAKCVCSGPMPRTGERVGGIDIGIRNPFAAVWGVLDQNRVLWLQDEIYVRGEPLSTNATRLPRDVMWYIDPHEANAYAELKKANFRVRRGGTDPRAGINAVNSRIRNGTLKIIEGKCANLLNESALHHYDPDNKNIETPVKENDHALDALRYLISRIDEGRMLRPSIVSPPPPDTSGTKGTGTDGPAPGPVASKPRPWCRLDNEALWTRIAP